MLLAVFVWFIVGVVMGWAASEIAESTTWVDKAVVITAGFLGAVAGGLIYEGLNLPSDALVGSSISAFAGAAVFSMALLAFHQRAARSHL